MPTAKTVEVTLGGDKYTLHKFNIGELERVAEITDGPITRTKAFSILRVAFERAEPKVDINGIEAEPDEIKDTIEKVMKLAGLNVPENPPPAPVGAQGQPGGQS